mmetsp:Transcript_42671/g.96098  ORF Transcript_42671/g.96098 Transcript_42671/m.96098 type:complete len:534 (+) Transcript_42671:108-1709(+)
MAAHGVKESCRAARTSISIFWSVAERSGGRVSTWQLRHRGPRASLPCSRQLLTRTRSMEMGCLHVRFAGVTPPLPGCCGRRRWSGCGTRYIGMSPCGSQSHAPGRWMHSATDQRVLMLGGCGGDWCRRSVSRWSASASASTFPSSRFFSRWPPCKDPTAPFEAAVHQACLEGCEDALRAQLGALSCADAEFAVNSRDVEGGYCLHHLGGHQQVGADLADLLLVFKAAVNCRDARGATPLHVAAREGNLPLVQVLIEHGADVNAQEETAGWTALHVAVSRRHTAVVIQLLMTDVVLVDVLDDFGWTPLLEAIARADTRSVALLTAARCGVADFGPDDPDVLAALDTGSKDIESKRWFCRILASNGMDPTLSRLHLRPEDMALLSGDYSSNSDVRESLFQIPDHLALCCMECEVSFELADRSVCASCAVHLCPDCVVEVVSVVATVAVAYRARFWNPRRPVGPTCISVSLDDEEAEVDIADERRSAAVEVGGTRCRKRQLAIDDGRRIQVCGTCLEFFEGASGDGFEMVENVLIL